MDSALITAAYTPWPHQVPSFQALMSGNYNRIITVWHRRGGKDMSAFNALWVKAARHKGNYGYFFPFATQGRKAIWHGITNEQMSFREYIPNELIESQHDTEMRITLTNGSTIQFIGTDNIDAKMGSNFAGVVMSEYPLQNPKAWDLIEPILKFNGGWAWFPYTPRGKENHGYTLYEAGKRLAAKGQPWFVERLSIDDTGLLVDSDLDDLRERGVEEEFIQQEYYCNFGVSNFGAYFARQMQALEEQGHAPETIPWNPSELVHTAWDFGVNDATSIWFLQEGKYGTWNAIDYYENNSFGLDHYLKELKNKSYAYGTHLVPHDSAQREFQSGMSTTDAAFNMGVHFTVVPRNPKITTIEATHRFLPMVYFSKSGCDDGILALKNYERKWDDSLKVFKKIPLHNWASNGTDAFMTFVMGNQMIASWDDDSKLPKSSQGVFDPRDY